MSDSQRILQRARRRGDLPVSRVALGIGGLGIAIACLPWLVRNLWSHASQQVQEALRQVSATNATTAIQATPGAVLGPLWSMAVPFTAALAAGALLLGLLQTRGVTGWKGQQTQRAPRWAAVVSGLGLLLVLLGGCTWIVVSNLEQWTETPSPDDMVHRLQSFGAFLEGLGWTCAGIALPVVAFDLWFVHSLWRQRNELTPSEERREQRQREIAPEIKAAQRQAAHQALLELRR